MACRRIGAVGGVLAAQRAGGKPSMLAEKIFYNQMIAGRSSHPALTTRSPDRPLPARPSRQPQACRPHRRRHPALRTTPRRVSIAPAATTTGVDPWLPKLMART